VAASDPPSSNELYKWLAGIYFKVLLVLTLGLSVRVGVSGLCRSD
jgi:hypothetical protein